MALRFTRNPYQQDGHDFQRCRGFGGGNVDTGYHYGYPAYGASEPNVVAQWLFDEYWDNFTGITLGGNPARFYTNSVVNAASPNAASFSVEWVASTTDTSGVIFSTQNTAGEGENGYYIYQSSSTQLLFLIGSEEGIFGSTTLTAGTAFNDGLIHKYVLRATRNGDNTTTAEIFIDNVSIGSSSFALPTTDTLKANRLYFGDYSAAPGPGNDWSGTLYEWRYSSNLTNDSGGPGSGTSPYNYGSSAQSGVGVHFKFQEASGNITSSASDATVLTANGSPTYSVAGAGKAAAIYDEVSGIKLTYNGGYDANQTATGGYAGLSPGMKNTSTAPTHVSAAGTASLDWTCNDGMVFEAWFKSTTNTAGQYWGLYSEGNGENANLRAYYFYTGASPTFAFYLISSDSTSKLWTPAVSTSVFDGNLHKVRLVIDPNGSGNGELFIDGVSQGTSTFAAFVGKTVTHELSRMSAIWASNSVTSNTTIYEIRESHNITNNSGGPGGG